MIGMQPPDARDAVGFKLETPRSVSEVVLLVFLTGAAIAFSVASPFLTLFFHDLLNLSANTIQGLGSIQALGQAAFAVLLGRRSDVRSRGQTMAIGLVIGASALAGIIISRNLLFVIPLAFFFGSGRAASYIAYSVLAKVSSIRTGAGQYGFYLTLEGLGFVVGSFLGGLLYSFSWESGFIITIGLWLVLALAAGFTGFRIKESSAGMPNYG